MQDFDGHERRVVRDDDWFQHKMSILNDLKTLKEESKETNDAVNKMKITLEVLQSKIMTGAGIVSFVMTGVGSYIMSLILK